MLAAMLWRGLYEHNWRIVTILGPLSSIWGYLMWSALVTGRMSNRPAFGEYILRESQPLTFWGFVGILGAGYFFAVGYFFLA